MAVGNVPFLMVNKMARINRPGLVFLHLIALLLGLLSILALKDMNFSNLSVAPDISTTQGLVMIILFLSACLIIALMYVLGLPRKQPKLGFLGAVSLFVVYSAILFLIVVGIYPKLTEDLTGTQQSYRMISVVIASGFILLGSMMFLLIKFPDDRERRWFMLAVRQEIKHPSKLICPVCETVVSSRSKVCYKCRTRLK